MMKYAVTSLLLSFAMTATAVAGTVCNRTLTVYDGTTPYKFAYCSNKDVTVRDTQVTTAIINVHGTGRTPISTSENVMPVMQAAGVFNSTVQVFPHFIDPTESDGQVFQDEFGVTDTAQGTFSSTGAHSDYLWEGAGDWDAGAYMRVGSSTTTGLSTFEVMDAFLQKFADNYPNLQQIIFTGHSAGGQMSANYHYAANMPLWRGVTWPENNIVFAPANPSNYTYLSDERPEQNNGTEHDLIGVLSFVNGFSPSNSALWCDYLDDTQNYSDSDNYWTQLADKDAPSDELDDCNEAPYMCGFSYAELRARAIRRKMVQFQGLLDDDVALPASPPSQSCPSHMQGGTRLDRGTAHFVHSGRQAGWDKVTKGNRDIIYVPGVAHSSSGIYNSTCGQWFLYGINAASCAPENRKAFYDDFDSGSWLSKWTQSGTGTFSLNNDNRMAGRYSAASVGPASSLTLTSPSITGLSGIYLVTWSWFLGSAMDAGDYISMEVLVDGGSWTEVDRLTGDTDTENTWISQGDHEFDVSSSIQIRFIVNSGTGEDVYIDQVAIQHLMGL